MKLTFLGTAAAEGFPAVFCNCDFCKKARESKDKKNVRTRSQALVNDDLLIDLPADTYMHFLENNIEGDKIKYLFITHSHPDHLYERELQFRGGCFAHNMRVPEIEIYCSKGAYNKITDATRDASGFQTHLIKPFDKITVENYEITALPARHYDGDDALFYIIKGDKTLLYAHDTGYFFEEVFDYIEKEHLRFDMISLDCTNVEIPISDGGSHMGFENISRLTQRLEIISAIDKDTVKYVNHFSHNGNPLHSNLTKIADRIGFKVSNDSLSVEF